MATDNPARRAEMKKPNIGVLALQGAVREHLRMLEDCGARGIAVRYPAELQLCRGLIIPGAATPTGVFLLRQYMLTIPDELLDSARIDGASEWRIYWQIVLPLARPALAVLAIFKR